MTNRALYILVLSVIVFIGWRQDGKDSVGREVSGVDTSLVEGRLIPATATMNRAWEVPRNPLTDSAALPQDKHLADQIRRGFMIFMQTPQEAARITGSAMSCNNCHPNGGQREAAMPLVGLSVIYPEYNKRAGRLFSLEDRIVGCFLRSCNAPGLNGRHKVASHENSPDGGLLSPRTPEVLAVAAYITWLSEGFSVGGELSWRGHIEIPSEKRIPIGKLEPKLGEKIFIEKCSSCHGQDGQGVDIGDKRAGPLWGPKSWNDGAGAARTYTLAGVIRSMMPYLDPGNLTDEEAQHIAAYITSKPRPQFPWKEKDYRTEKIPVDAVYYPQVYSTHPLRKGD